MSHLPSRQTLVLAALAIALVAAPAMSLHADDAPPSLHQRIDELVNATQFGPLADRAEDATFLRRIYLDFLGRIPSIAETRAFLSDQNDNKRTVLIDELLSRPDFNKSLAVTFDVMLMERRGGAHVNSEEFRKYLEDSFAAGKSYRQLVKEILAADGTDEKNRAASAFYLERDVTPDLLTREIGRVFFGVDLQCAQCHNHPNIDDYHQDDYYGLQAFVIRASLFRPDPKKPALIAEKADGEASFKSVFTDRASMTGPRPLLGDEVIEVALKPGERYQVEPAKNIRQIPSYSRLAKLSEVVTDAPTPAFNRNISNRLWAHMLGRGLVHPVDLHHSGNPPAHPQLMELISTDFAAHDYDIKYFLREIALSETYQRSPRLPENLPTVEEAQAQAATLAAEAESQLKKSREVDQQVDAATVTLDAAMDELRPLLEAIEKANKAVTESLKAQATADAKVTARQKSLKEKEAQIQLVHNAHESAKLAVASLKEDKELATATATILKRFEALQAEHGTLKTAEAGELAAVAQADEELKATEATADAAIAAAKPAEEKVRNLRTAQIELRTLAAEHRRQSALAKQQSEQFQAIREYGELKQTIANLTTEIPGTQMALTTAQQTVPTYEKTLAEHQTFLSDASQSVVTAQSTLKQTAAALFKSETTKSLLVASVSKLDEAVLQLEGENGLAAAKAEIAKTIATLDNSIAKHQSDQTSQQMELDTKTKLKSDAEQTLKVAEAKLKEQQQLVTALETTLSNQRQQLEASQKARDGLWQTIVEQSATRLNAAEVVQLTPEQLGWSVFIAAGQRDRQRAADAAKLNKEKPLSEADLKDPEKVAAREREIDELTYETLSKSVARFVQLFGAGPGQPQGEFFATADQALFFANGGEIRSWLSPAAGNLTERLTKIEDPSELSNELYLTIFCRHPTTEEVADVTQYLESRTDAKPAAVQELAWGLLTSVEFRFQY